MTLGIAWNLRRSIFAPREREADSQDFFDNMEVYEKAFDVDWRSSGLEPFLKSPEDARHIRSVLWTHYPDLVRIFEHFTTVKHPLKSNEVFCMRAPRYALLGMK